MKPGCRRTRKRIGGVREAIMNYDGHVYAVDGVNERDCSPYPLDVRAVWALYQQIVP